MLALGLLCAWFAGLPYLLREIWELRAARAARKAKPQIVMLRGQVRPKLLPPPQDREHGT
jgi:hypothetical protein